MDLNVVQFRTPDSIFFYSQYTFNVIHPLPANAGCGTSDSLVPNVAAPLPWIAFRAVFAILLLVMVQRILQVLARGTYLQARGVS